MRDNYPWDEWRKGSTAKNVTKPYKFVSYSETSWVDWDAKHKDVKPANFEKGPSPMAEELAKQIIAWHKAGHSLYPVDVLNMMIDTQVIKEEDLKPIIESFKKNPVEPKLPKTYITE